MQEEAVRWNIKVSKDTDVTLQTFLGSHGMKRGDRSKFVEQAVRAHIFHRTIQDIKARNAGTEPAELQDLIDNAVREVRQKRRARQGNRRQGLMRVVLDTNIPVSALLVQVGHPAVIYRVWQEDISRS